MQFIGPIKQDWIDAIKAAGLVPVQYVSMHAYIVGGRQSSIHSVRELSYVQWVSQMHRSLKPSLDPQRPGQHLVA